MNTMQAIGAIRRRPSARDAAALRLVRIKPTTIDGAIALLYYFADIGADDVPPTSDRAAKSSAPRSAALSPATSLVRLNKLRRDTRHRSRLPSCER
jgi:hypothetical protein